MEKNRGTLRLPGEVHIIGCGGVGSWVIPALVRLPGEFTISLWDGDTLEEKNLDRQLFSSTHIGMNKAAAIDLIYIATMFDVNTEYFHDGSPVGDRSLILCCADNHSARRAVLAKCDETNSTAIIAGNEYTDADAYIYRHYMYGGPNDPRVFAPEILTDNSGDPRRPDGCTGEAARVSPQLVLANMAAATHMLRLLWWWYAETERLDPETKEFWPVMHRTSASRSFTVLLKDRLAERRDAV